MRKQHYRSAFDAAELALLAIEAGVHWEKSWPLTKAFLDLHDVDGLKDLAKEWSLKLPAGDVSKASAMEAILAAAENRRLPVPEVVRKVLKGK